MQPPTPDVVKILVMFFEAKAPAYPLPWSVDLESYKASVGVVDARGREIVVVQNLDQAKLLVAFAQKQHDEHTAFMQRFEAFMDANDHDGLVDWLNETSQ